MKLLRWIKAKIAIKREMAIINALAKSNGKVTDIPKFKTFPVKWE